MFKELFLESGAMFNQEDYKDKAEQWLKDKYGDKYTYKFKPKLTDPDKVIYASDGENEFGIAGKKFDTNGDGNPDTILFKILPIEEEDSPEEEEEF